MLGTEINQCHEQLRSCIRAAREAVESINGSARYKVLYPAFWFSQYVAFSAISIIHIYIIQMSRQRISTDLFGPSSEDAGMMHPNVLYELALVGQHRLAEAGVNSAPVWRYGPILESLSAQTGRYLASQTDGSANEVRLSLPKTTHLPPDSGVGRNTSLLDQGTTNISDEHIDTPLEMDATWTSGYEDLWDDLMTGIFENDGLTMEFWPQFDNLPVTMLK